MINEYNVKYSLGNKKNCVYELLVSAHDEIEARKIVVPQAHNRHGGSAKVNIVGVVNDNEFTPTVLSPVVAPPVKPMNWNSCISTSVISVAVLTVITALACTSPIWLVYILLKLIGG